MIRRWDLPVIFYTLMPFATYYTGGLESGFAPLYFLIPLGIMYLTESVWLSVGAAILTILEIVVLYALQARGRAFPSTSDVFYPEIVVTSVLVTAATLLVGFLFAKKIDDTNEKLFVSRKLSSIAGMVNGLAHEVNNPLAII